MRAYCSHASSLDVHHASVDHSRRRACVVTSPVQGNGRSSGRGHSISFRGVSSWDPVAARRRALVVSASSTDGTSGTAEGVSSAAVLRIVLMRHADSEAASSSTTDHERSVTQSGVSKVQSIAKSLKSLGYIPNLFLSSNSARSKQTYASMIQAMPELEVADAHFFGSLYTESQMDGHTLPHLMELIRNLGDVRKHSCVLCLGHNKGWEEAASALAGERVELKNGDAALFEMELGAHGGDGIVDGWKDAMSKVGQKSGWRFRVLLTE